jgi:sulfur-oxidizing protein SoxY
MNPLRRTLLKGTGGVGAVAVALATGLLKPGQVLAAEWNKPAFDSKGIIDALKGVGGTTAIDSKDITIKAPDIAENGAVVPVEVASKIPATESITILIEKNDRPLIAIFNMLNGAEGFVSTRVKMAQTSDIKILVKAGGKIYTARKEVKVTIGGCGG